MRKRAILLISAGFLSGCLACATFVACTAEEFVEIWGIDHVKGRLYYGVKDDPKKSLPFADPLVEAYLCLSKSDWDAVRVRLAACPGS